MPADPRRHSPAAERNGPPILAELRRLLPDQGLLLEIASGTGQHAACCAPGLPGWRWQPSERDPELLPSIAAWCAGIANVEPALPLDLLAPPPLPTVDAVFCANLIHIAPWACTAALMRLAAERLAPAGLLIMYGPYLEDKVATAPSNLAFDEDLRARNPAWGLRRLAAVQAEAAAVGLQLHERVPMPANNLLLAWRRTSR